MRFLLVDDEVAITQLLQQFLSRSGHTCAVAGTVQEARSAVAEATQSFDAAVLDLFLPDGNGEDLAREILKAQPQIQLVLASGMAHDVSPDLAAKVIVLQKPFMPRALLKVLADGH